MTESNTGSDIGPNSPRGGKPVGVPLRDHKSGETRIVHFETRRQRMTRVIKTTNTRSRNKRKKK